MTLGERVPIVAAMRLYAGNGGIYGAAQNTVTAGEAASGFVLPLILDIGIFSFLALIVIMLAPPEDEILADARLAGRLTGGRSATAARVGRLRLGRQRGHAVQLCEIE